MGAGRRRREFERLRLREGGRGRRGWRGEEGVAGGWGGWEVEGHEGNVCLHTFF